MPNTTEAAAAIQAITTMDNDIGERDDTIQAQDILIAHMQQKLLASGGVDFPDLQARPWSKKSGAGSGGSSANHGTCDMSQNADGSKRISVTPGPGPNKVGYDNFLFGIDGLFIPRIGQVVRVLDTVKFKLSDPTLCQAVEAENQRNMNMRKANMAACCIIAGSGSWDYFHYTGSAGGAAGWHPIPGAPPLDHTMLADWVTWELETLLDDDAGTVTHQSITINGAHYPITGVVQPMAQVASGSRWDVNFQLDSKGCKLGSVPPPFYCNVFRSVRIEFPTDIGH